MSTKKHAFIQYPFAGAGDFGTLNLTHDAVLVTQNPQPALAFYRDTLIGFLPMGKDWIGRDWPSNLHGTRDRRDFEQRLGIRVRYTEDAFWGLYLDEMTHPQVLLDIAARQARESLDGL